MFVYILTFIICLFTDKVKNPTFKKVFICWLYLFLCFGYTVGSDWRQYEYGYLLSFDELQTIRPLYVLFNFISSTFHELGIDFWLYTGLFKCFFLYAVIQVIKLFTDKVFFVLGLLLPSVFLFMLINGPFKFMMAVTLLLFGFRALLHNRKGIFGILVLCSVFIHFTAGILALFIFLIHMLKNRIKNASFFILFILLISLTIVSTSLSFFTSLTSFFVLFVPILEGKAESYGVESTAGWLTLGSLINYFSFFVVYYCKPRILKLPYGEYIYAASIFKFMLFGFLLIIPTGFRFNEFNMILYGIGCASICINLTDNVKSLRFRPIAVCFIMSYSAYSLCTGLWNTYLYIPYTNSIPYIVTGTSGDNFFERSEKGYANYFERTGQEIKKDE